MIMCKLQCHNLQLKRINIWLTNYFHQTSGLALTFTIDLWSLVDWRLAKTHLFTDRINSFPHVSILHLNKHAKESIVTVAVEHLAAFSTYQRQWDRTINVENLTLNSQKLSNFSKINRLKMWNVSAVFRTINWNFCFVLTSFQSKLNSSVNGSSCCCDKWRGKRSVKVIDLNQFECWSHENGWQSNRLEIWKLK